MLLRFSFSNFRSFLDEQELSLVASEDAADSPHPPLRVPAVSEGVLPVAAVFGANASGKSNLLKAIGVFGDAVAHSFSGDGIGWEPFALHVKRVSFPSQFVADLLWRKQRVQFGFAVKAGEVTEEWLFAYPLARRQVLYHRRQGQAMIFGKGLRGEQRTIERLTPPRALFLSVAAATGHRELAPLAEQIRAWQWETLDPSVAGSARNLLLESMPDRSRITAMIRAADLGIEGISVQRKQDEQYRKQLAASAEANPNSALARSLKRLIEGMSIDVGYFYRFHGPAQISLSEREQSQGTRAYLTLVIYALQALERGSVLLVDELDRSLHPVLARQIIGLFTDRATNKKGAQLIFNTHDTNLLAPDLLRRDEVWFCEKNRANISHIYPLTDFHSEQGEDVESSYLQGRFGSIPYPLEPALALSESHAKTRRPAKQ